MAYIKLEDLRKFPFRLNSNDFNLGAEAVIEYAENLPTADVEEVRHGEWNLEVHSFYADNFDESIELCIYILANCSNCGTEHSPKQVFSKHLYAPEDADDYFRFDQEYEKAKALEEFKQRNYKFQKYCSECGAKMYGGKTE
jgi:hypothetical protein